jgi:hypothetical protein
MHMKALIRTIAAAVLVLSMGSAALRAADLPPVEEKQIEALIAAMRPFLEEELGNPSSGHLYGVYSIRHARLS